MKYITTMLLALALTGCYGYNSQTFIDSYTSKGYKDVVVKGNYVYYTIPEENVRCREHVSRYDADSCWKLGGK